MVDLENEDECSNPEIWDEDYYVEVEPLDYSMPMKSRKVTFNITKRSKIKPSPVDDDDLMVEQ
jgi:hypothetical protein